jgi:hypothetical protein
MKTRQRILKQDAFALLDEWYHSGRKNVKKGKPESARQNKENTIQHVRSGIRSFRIEEPERKNQKQREYNPSP